eukprot:COSAG05_NODE_355_length_10856_cov_7.197174_8_plen_57_part_00
MLAIIRNTLITRFLKPHHEHVLWLDADVVRYPPDMVTRLHAANPGALDLPPSSTLT